MDRKNKNLPLLSNILPVYKPVKRIFLADKMPPFIESIVP